jgi:hypothetical protein
LTLGRWLCSTERRLFRHAAFYQTNDDDDVIATGFRAAHQLITNPLRRLHRKKVSMLCETATWRKNIAKLEHSFGNEIELNFELDHVST